MLIPAEELHAVLGRLPERAELPYFRANLSSTVDNRVPHLVFVPHKGRWALDADQIDRGQTADTPAPYDGELFWVKLATGETVYAEYVGETASFWNYHRGDLDVVKHQRIPRATL